MPYAPSFYSDLLANAFQRWNKIRLNNDKLRHNKTIESFSSSHSSKLQFMLLESWDAFFLSLKFRIPSGKEYCIEPREYRNINFNQYHLELVCFFFIKLLIHFKFFYGHNLFHLDNSVPDEEETISKSKKIPISGRIWLQNPYPVHHWSAAYTDKTICLFFCEYKHHKLVAKKALSFVTSWITLSDISFLKSKKYPDPVLIQFKKMSIQIQSCSDKMQVSFRISNPDHVHAHLFWTGCDPNIVTYKMYSKARLGHQGERRVFWEDDIFLKVCLIVLKHVQHIFPGGENFSGDAPLVTGLCTISTDGSSGGSWRKRVGGLRNVISGWTYWIVALTAFIISGVSSHSSSPNRIKLVIFSCPYWYIEKINETKPNKP